MKARKNDLEEVIDNYGNLLYKICFPILKNEQDTKDVLQETFLAYYTKKPSLKSEEHRKAWLIKVSQNKCKEFLRFHKRHACLCLEDMEENTAITDGLREDEKDLLSMIWDLDYKLKSVVLLHYFEGYSVGETAELLKISPAAVKKRLQRAREALRTEYEGELLYEE